VGAREIRGTQHEIKIRDSSSHPATEWRGSRAYVLLGVSLGCHFSHTTPFLRLHHPSPPPLSWSDSFRDHRNSSYDVCGGRYYSSVHENNGSTAEPETGFSSVEKFSELLHRLQAAYLNKVYWQYLSFTTRVSQLKIWHFWVTGIERNICRCTFNRYSVITQFTNLAAGEQLCRRCTQKIIALQNPLKVSPEKSQILICDTVVLWHCCVVTVLCCDTCVVTLLCCDTVVLWHCCVVTVLCCDTVVLWQWCVVIVLCCDTVVFWHCYVVTLVLWHCRVVTLLCCDTCVVTLLRCDTCVVTLLRCDTVVLWQCCVVTLLCCDSVALWQCCAVTVLCCDSVVLWHCCVVTM